ncbi:hypothetical protein P4O66_011418 [Electrophorus voltai]|uniref:Connector enhancer of kinase suppressor of Ras 1 n=1 Tax=Electrophorus voltai TaxID=2609070 RepID=A0AAD8Z699_9TELE|nr:hypothetical protein P4O66_011418 [Electrophorus voltai]
MDPVTSWSAESVSRWLRGLASSLQQYAFEQWQLSGVDLLQLSSQQLHQLGVHKLGHQELVLEAVEKLCSLTYGLGGESLRSLTEKLRAVAHSLQMGIQSRWCVNTYDGQSATKLPASVLQDVVELITAAKGLFFLLNRYQHTQISGCTGSQNIIPLCKDLGSTIHKEITVFEKEKDIIATSRQLVAICDEILSSAPEGLLTHATQLQSVELVPTIPGQQLGLEITSTPSNQHYVSSTAEKCPSESSKILAGDEVIQVNDQIVVGWSRKYLEEKLQESPHGISLLLRRMPFSLRRRDERGDSSVSIKRSNKPIEFSFSPGEEKVSEEEQEERGRHAVLTHTPASVRCCSYRAAVLTPEGQELSERVTDYSFDGSQSFTSSTDQQTEGSETGLVRRGLGEEPSTMRRSPSPLSLDSNRVRMGSCPEMGGNGEEKENKKYSIKGTQTALSRRRVSCRELGRPDCDGWLWKKRKESSVFMTQKWQRFWFVLKGATIYWYTSQQVTLQNTRRATVQDRRLYRTGDCTGQATVQDRRLYRTRDGRLYRTGDCTGRATVQDRRLYRTGDCTGQATVQDTRRATVQDRRLYRTRDGRLYRTGDSTGQATLQNTRRATVQDTRLYRTRDGRLYRTGDSTGRATLQDGRLYRTRDGRLYRTGDCTGYATVQNTRRATVQDRRLYRIGDCTEHATGDSTGQATVQDRTGDCTGQATVQNTRRATVQDRRLYRTGDCTGQATVQNTRWATVQDRRLYRTRDGRLYRTGDCTEHATGDSTGQATLQDRRLYRTRDGRLYRIRDCTEHATGDSTGQATLQDRRLYRTGDGRLYRTGDSTEHATGDCTGQEEKAVGLVKIGSYSIESAGEHKRKYVFKMSHPRFQNFFFAADNVTDMSKWINSLITAIQKYRKFQQNLPDSEAECYSETESEEDGSNSPRLPKKKASTKVQSNTLPRKSKPKGGGATTTLPAGGSKAAGAEDEMGDLFNKLKEGGVSLIGQSQPITHDQLRRSFIRRNKNPVINEKIHTLRALQSTLKAKEAELQIINKLLEDSELTSLKFLQWKQCNEELYQEIQKLSAERNRHQTAPPPMAVAGGDSRVYDLSLSDGEQLVDSDVPSDGDSTLVTGHAHSGYADVHGDQTESGSSDKYFYI